MSRHLIRKALESRAAGMTGALPIAGENAPFAPQQDQPYWRFNLLFADPDNSIQCSTQYIEQGIFQITLCYPRDAGPRSADQMADAIRSAFKRGTTLACDDGVQVVVPRTPSIGQPIPNTVAYEVPVSIRWQALIAS